MPTGIIRGENYYVEVGGSNWRDAQSNSRALGGDLFSINSQSDQDFLVSNWGRTYDDIYIGNNDLNNDGIWTLSDGSPQQYSNWLPGYPTNRNGTGVAVVITRDWFHPWESNWNTNQWYSGSVDAPLTRQVIRTRVGTGTIAEIPLSYFSISDLTLTEGSSGSVTITRTGGTRSTQNLTLTSSNQTATAGSDYNAISTTVRFAAGETSRTVSIWAINDSAVESSETFNLVLTASSTDAVPAQIADRTAVVTIRDAGSTGRGNTGAVSSTTNISTVGNVSAVNNASAVGNVSAIANIRNSTNSRVAISANGSLPEFDNIIRSSTSLRLRGTAENDAIIGGPATALMTGGGGSDQFRFNWRGVFRTEEPPSITDFDSAEGDVIILPRRVFRGTRTISLGTADNDVELRRLMRSRNSFVYSSDTGELYWNANRRRAGWGRGGDFAVLEGAPSLAVTDLALL